MPPELRTPAAVAGVALLSVLVAVLFSVAGAYRLWSASAQGWETTGRVTVAVSCAGSARAEEVEYRRDGLPVRAELDACGHRDGEEVPLTVTDDGVHLGGARSGATTDARVLGGVLAVFAGLAGAGYVVLYRRGL